MLNMNPRFSALIPIMIPLTKTGNTGRLTREDEFSFERDKFEGHEYIHMKISKKSLKTEMWNLKER